MYVVEHEVGGLFGLVHDPNTSEAVRALGSVSSCSFFSFKLECVNSLDRIHIRAMRQDTSDNRV
jgi:hypothetical protein